MNRASDVPPDVESSGLKPVRAVDRLRNEIGESIGLGEEGRTHCRARRRDRSAQLLPPLAQRRAISASSVAGVQRSLNLTLKCACAFAGMTFIAGLPTSIVTISRFDGSKCARALIERRGNQRVEQAQEMRDRIVGALRIGDMALHAVHDEPGR